MRKYKNAKGTAYRRGKNLQLTRKVKNSKTSDQIYSKNWPKYGGSLKACFVDTDLDGFKDSVRSKYRSPAVLKGNACHVLPPIPITGPSNISASIATPITGPSGITSTIATPISGPSNISAEIIQAPISGPSNISAEIIQAPISGPSGITSTILPPTTGPSNLTALIIIPSTLTVSPFLNYSGIGGPILGVPTPSHTSFESSQPVSVLAPFTFTFTDTWSLVFGARPEYRCTFQKWSTNLPGLNNSTDPAIGSRGPWPPSGGTYTAQPIYTKVRIN